MLGRTEVLGQDDVPVAIAIQQRYQPTPLSRWLDSNLPPEQPPKPMVPVTYTVSRG
jgi:hypothetical protein